MNTKQLLKKVRKIEIKTRRLSNHIFGGEYHSKFKGRGMIFSEVRQYQFGDDVRNIDWNVTARHKETYVKIFEEERELTMILMADVSGSEFFGTSVQFKNEYIAEICATLAFSAIQNNDKIGLVLFSDQIELYIPPKKGRFHVLRIIRELIEFKPQSRKTNLSEAFKFLSQIIKKRAIVFVLSDFMDSGYEKNLQVLNKKHDVTGIRIYDKREDAIPNIGVVSMEDLETGESFFVDTTSKKVRDAYNEHYKERMAYFKSVFSKSGAGSLSVEVSESYVKTLLLYFKTK